MSYEKKKKKEFVWFHRKNYSTRHIREPTNVVCFPARYLCGLWRFVYRIGIVFGLRFSFIVTISISVVFSLFLTSFRVYPRTVVKIPFACYETDTIVNSFREIIITIQQRDLTARLLYKTRKRHKIIFETTGNTTNKATRTVYYWFYNYCGKFFFFFLVHLRFAIGFFFLVVLLVLNLTLLRYASNNR